jgi:hypothetical protein
MRKIVGLATTLALAALVVSFAALPASASTQKSAHRSATKKKKKKTVLVKCAAVKVCPSHPGKTGPQGPAGLNGLNGTNGTNGANGTAIVDRARTGGPLATAECVSSGSNTCPNQGDALHNATWTQGATEDDHLVGSVTVTYPSSMCTDSGGSNGGDLEGEVLLDGQVSGIFGSSIFGPGGPSSNGNAGSSLTMPVFFLGGLIGTGVSNDILGSGTATPHTLTALVSDTCHNGPHFVVNSIAVDAESYL